MKKPGAFRSGQKFGMPRFGACRPHVIPTEPSGAARSPGRFPPHVIPTEPSGEARRRVEGSFDSLRSLRAGLGRGAVANIPPPRSLDSRLRRSLGMTVCWSGTGTGTGTGREGAGLRLAAGGGESPRLQGASNPESRIPIAPARWNGGLRLTCPGRQSVQCWSGGSAGRRDARTTIHVPMVFNDGTPGQGSSRWANPSSESRDLEKRGRVVGRGAFRVTFALNSRSELSRSPHSLYIC